MTAVNRISAGLPVGAWRTAIWLLPWHNQPDRMRIVGIAFTPGLAWPGLELSLRSDHVSAAGQKRPVLDLSENVRYASESCRL